MKKLLLIALLIPNAVLANQITPAFTTGSSNSTNNTTQTITRTHQIQVYGSTVSTWEGTNVTPSASITASDTTYTVSDATVPWSLNITTRAAGLVEQHDISENITTTSTITSLSVFSQ
jgi:hypothetical protein